MNTFGEYFEYYKSDLCTFNMSTKTNCFFFYRSKRCFSLEWPMNFKSDFFRHSDGIQPANEVFISLLLVFCFFCHILFRKGERMQVQTCVIAYFFFFNSK